MSDKMINGSVWDVVYLASCSIQQIRPAAERLASLDLDAAYNMAKRHSLTAVCNVALEEAGIHHEQFMRSWLSAVRKTTIMDSERMSLTRSMDEAGIWYMPLKGCVIKDYYPEYGMREMSDHDILFDSTYAQEVRSILAAQGFECVNFGSISHDIYYKQPVCNFEMHRMLFGPGIRSITQYYAELDRLLVPNDDGTMGFHMSDEEFYLYMIAHEFWHYANSGTGFRSL